MPTPKFKPRDSVRYMTHLARYVREGTYTGRALIKFDDPEHGWRAQNGADTHHRPLPAWALVSGSRGFWFVAEDDLQLVRRFGGVQDYTESNDLLDFPLKEV